MAPSPKSFDKSSKSPAKKQPKMIEPISEDEESSVAESIKPLAKPTGASRLFVPYRSLGILSNGVPFFLVPHQSSASSLLVLSIGDRFQMLQCDKLQPVLVSQTVPSQINRLVSDASLSITAVAHGSSHVTLFQRLKPLVTKRLCHGKSHKIVDLLHLGKMQVQGTGEKEGRTENAVILAAILCQTKRDEEQNDNVTLVGDDDDDESDDESDDDDSFVGTDAPGQVVILVATRDNLYVQNQCDLPIHPTIGIHPSTYVNKILVGGHDGGLVLVNIRSGKVIHQFKCVSGDDKITALQQSPAVDTVAVGCHSGMVHLINLRHDKRLFGLSHDSPVSSLSFRTDASALRYDVAPLAVGRLDGTVSIWDLSPPAEDDDDDDDKKSMGRTLLSEMTKLHPGGVSSLQYLPQEPVLVSTGKTSNSVLMHVFDNPDHSGRLWKSRKGHTSPPQCIQYLHPATNGLLAQAVDGTDASACQILSGGSSDRTLRVFSSARSVLDKEYSQGRGLERQSKKLGLDSTAELLLPPITAIAASEAHTRDWGDMVTIHQHHAMAYVWSTKRGAQSGPVLRQKHWNVSAMKVAPPKSAHATSVTLSSCGNYALVGTQGGVIYKYNIQSGIVRGRYPPNESDKDSRRPKAAGDIRRTMKALEKKFKVSNRKSDQDKEQNDAVVEHEKEQRRQAKLQQASHKDAAVTGLAVDAVNKTLISVGTDSKLILWNFVTHAPHKRSPYMLPAAATKLSHVRDSDLAAIALNDFSVVLFDCSALQIVRRFGGGQQNHTGPISDMAFAPDGRSLYTASLDRTIRVWDVPTNHCVDWMGFRTAPTSITVSPTGEFLATTHADRLGISLWSDRTYYQTVFLDASKPPQEPIQMDDPVPIAETTDGTSSSLMIQAFDDSIKALDQLAEEEDEIPPEPKEAGIATLSGLPPAHWKNLFHLELVKERNKPEEAPKKPPTAPFFLQWRGGEDVGPLKEEEEKQAAEGENEEWAAAWSDDEDEKMLSVDDKKRAASKDVVSNQPKSKKRRIAHHRSHLASLLHQCSESNDYQPVTEHIGTLGPSAIDVSLSTLCNGMHDLTEGLPLLHKAALWLLQAGESRQRYEAVNAYLHRFLYLHANTICGIEEYSTTDGDEEEKPQFEEERAQLVETIGKLRQVQTADGLKDKMQHSLCLLRHFLRMV